MKTLATFIILLASYIFPTALGDYAPLSFATQQSSQELEVSENQLADGTIEIIGKNNQICPISVKLSFEGLRNFRPSSPNGSVVVIPAKSSVTINALQMKRKNTASSYAFSLTHVLGDTENAKHDDNFVYRLPFENGKSYYIGQGYKGTFSHFEDYALDFDMDEGTKIHASRDGIVVNIKTDSNRGCKRSKCKADGNFILVYHDDGSFANYYHLQQGGSIVQIGDKVVAGQHIGYSGNTGWSSGPHLHFEVYTPGWNRNYTLPTKFLIEKDKSATLKEGKAYTAVEL